MKSKKSTILRHLRINHDCRELLWFSLRQAGKTVFLKCLFKHFRKIISHLMEQMLQYLLRLEFNDIQFHFL